MTRAELRHTEEDCCSVKGKTFSNAVIRLMERLSVEDGSDPSIDARPQCFCRKIGASTNALRRCNLIRALLKVSSTIPTQQGIGRHYVCIKIRAMIQICASNFRIWHPAVVHLFDWLGTCTLCACCGTTRRKIHTMLVCLISNYFRKFYLGSHCRRARVHRNES